MNVELVIFGCDGVLVDSHAILVGAIRQGLLDAGREVSRETVSEALTGRSVQAAIATLGAMTGGRLSDESRQSIRERLITVCRGDIRATDGLWCLLDRLQVNRCVATAACERRADSMLTASGLRPVFDGKVFTESQVARGTPAPDLLLAAAAAMGAAPSRTLVVDGCAASLAAGFAAGMRCLFYAGVPHLDGADLGAWEEIGVLRHWRDFPLPLGGVEPPPPLVQLH